MGISSGKSDSSSNSNAKFNEQVWATQAPYLKDLYGNALNQYGRNYAELTAPDAVRDQAYAAQFEGSRGAIPWWHQQMHGGAYQGVDPNMIMNDIRQSQNMPSNTGTIYAQMMGGQGNTYADAMKDRYIKDANKATANMMNVMDARAAGSGMSGSSRHGVAQGVGTEAINENLQRNLAQVGYETFDKDLQNKLGIAQMADQNTLARQQMQMDMLAGKQSAMQGGLNFAPNIGQLGMDLFKPFAATWGPTNQLAAMLGAPTILGSGEMTGSGDSSSKGMGIGK
jgi:hypothetical protein